MKYTSKEQSEKLVGLGLEKDTCDFAYLKNSETPTPVEQGKLPANATPCWSCDRLFELLPMEVNMDKFVWKLSIYTQKEDNMYVVTYACNNNTFSKNSTTFFDAVYDMMHDILLYFQ